MDAKNFLIFSLHRISSLEEDEYDDASTLAAYKCEQRKYNSLEITSRIWSFKNECADI